ncbi:hypothetical protein CDAR_308741 [Caerostris darwini]|uniref:Uncharacterized protein n=1 Tax=Caerostris darwini TaxID=1538125 RepID=A0AAV4NUL9_9ARAC|nr:hypothetical protein CDAR_308741 [Caerostris darwini]
MLSKDFFLEPSHPACKVFFPSHKRRHSPPLPFLPLHLPGNTPFLRPLTEAEVRAHLINISPQRIDAPHARCRSMLPSSPPPRYPPNDFFVWCTLSCTLWS